MQKDSNTSPSGNELRGAIIQCQKILDDPREINKMALRHDIDYDTAWMAIEMALEEFVHELLT